MPALFGEGPLKPWPIECATRMRNAGSDVYRRLVDERRRVQIRKQTVLDAFGTYPTARGHPRMVDEVSFWFAGAGFEDLSDRGGLLR